MNCHYLGLVGKPLHAACPDCGHAAVLHTVGAPPVCSICKALEGLEETVRTIVRDEIREQEIRAEESRIG